MTRCEAGPTRSDTQAIEKHNARRLPRPMIGIVGGLNAEKAIPPPRIVLEADILDDEIQLPLRLPLHPPRMMGFLERLTKFYVLDLIRRWKQTDHEIRRLFGSRAVTAMTQSLPRQCNQSRPGRSHKVVKLRGC
jgi:hypothetical protein